MSGAWRIAWRNLRRNRRRNVATGLAIALGFAGLALLFGYAARVERFLRDTSVYLQHTGHLAIWREGGLEKSLARPAAYSLDRAQQEQVADVLAHDPRVAFSGRYLRGMGLAGNGCRSVPFVALGIEPEVLRRALQVPELQRSAWELVPPVKGNALFAYADVPGAVGLSTGLAKRLGKLKIHDELAPGTTVAVPDCSAPDLTIRLAADANIQLAARSYGGSLSAADGEVVNVFRTPSVDTEDQTLHTSLATLQSLYDTDTVTYVAVFLKDYRNAQRMVTDLQRALDARRLPLRVYWYGDESFNPAYAGAMAFVTSLVGFITVLVTAVVALGVLNAMTLTTLERARELGTLRALGYRRGHLAALFLREGALLAGLGVLLGLLVALLAAAGVAAARIRFSPPGIPGTLQLLVTPGPTTFLVLAAIFLPLTALATMIAVRAQARRRTSDLLTAVGA